MTSGLSMDSPRLSTSTPVLPLGRRSRRASLESASSRSQFEKDRMSQALDQIHNAASQLETLTTFNDFTPAPSSSSPGETKGLAVEIQGGLSGLYSRFRASVGGVRDMVGGVTAGEEKGIPDDKSVSSPTSSLHRLKEKPRGVKTPTVAIPSPTAGSTNNSQSQSSLTTSLTDAPTNNSDRPPRGKKESPSATVTVPKHSAPSSSPNGSKGAPPSLTRATTSTAADPRLAEVHVVAVKDVSPVGGSNLEQQTDRHRREFSPKRVSPVLKNEETVKASIGQGTSLMERDLERNQTPVADAESLRSSRHERSITSTSENQRHASSEESSTAVSQDELLTNSINNVHDTQRLMSRDHYLRQPVELDRRLNNLTEQQHTRDDAPSPHSAKITNAVQHETDPLPTKENTENSSVDLPMNLSINYTRSNPRLDNPEIVSRTSTTPRVSQSHLPGFTISRASSSENDGQGSMRSLKGTKVQDQIPIMKDEIQNVDRRRIDLPVTANGGPTNSNNIVMPQIRSKVLSKDYWMRDENAKDCFYCGDTFSTFRRKHHCRKH